MKIDRIGAGKHLWDSQSQIDMCLNCPLEECINCIESGLEESIDLKPVFEKISVLKASRKKLTKGEKAVLRVYPDSINDNDMAKRLKKVTSSVCALRNRLGLPPIRLTSMDARKKLVALWTDEVRT